MLKHYIEHFVISSDWSIFHLELGKTDVLLEMNLRDKNTKNLVIWDPFHIMYCLIWKICRQKLKKMYQIKYCNYYRISTDIKIVFFSLKVGDIFSAKKSVSKYPRSFVYCRFICPDCNASFISESIYLTMRIKQPCETHSELIF